MKQKKLFLLVGAPASGKSTWAKTNIDNIHMTNAAKCAYVSRDEIRFSLLKDGEDYFSHEDEVMTTFIQNINDNLLSEEFDFIFADATHLSEKSRYHVLDRLNLYNVDIIPVVFDVPLDVCISQNKNRTGRERVPESAIRRMYYSMAAPTHNEKYKYERIITIKGV